MSTRLTPGGNAFLKCAFAAPDFDSTGGGSVPDLYTGRSLPRQHVLTTPFTFTSGHDTYLIFLPIPGTAFITTSVPNGNGTAGATWTSTQFADFSSLFTSSNFSTNVNSFRYVAQSAEIQPTVNEMTWIGNIEVWKQPIRISTVANFTTIAAGGAQTIRYLNGFDGLNNAPVSDIYSAPFNKGAYAVGCARNSTFDFTPMLPGVNATTVIDTTDGSFVNVPLTGVGDIDAIVMRVSVPTSTGPDMSALIRTWSCVEYTPVVTSALYQYSSLSASYDPTALALYAHIVKNLPLAVPFSQNANFWQRVLEIIRSVTNATSSIPGPIGLFSTGVRGIVEGIAAL